MRIRAAGIVSAGVLLVTIGAAGAPAQPDRDAYSDKPSGLDPMVPCLTANSEAEMRSCADLHANAKCSTSMAEVRPKFDMAACRRAENPAGGPIRTGEEDNRIFMACSFKESEYEQAQNEQRKKSVVDHRGCLEGVKAQVDGFLTAEKSCAAFGQYSACAPFTNDAVFRKCVLSCIDARDPVLDAAEQQGLQECESRYVEAKGRAKFTCSIAGATPGVDVKKLEVDFKTAMQAHDGSALDAAGKVSDGEYLARAQVDCTKACNEEGPKLLVAQQQSVTAEKQGPALVVAYKRCMVSADSTAEARKLAAYEVTLYCDYRKQADTRCRTASRCDWLEQYSSARCDYVTPGDSCP